MTPDELERHIKDCGALMEAAWAQYEQSGCFDARGEADRWRVAMSAAIKSRTPETVAKMEEERGLA